MNALDDPLSITQRGESLQLPEERLRGQTDGDHQRGVDRDAVVFREAKPTAEKLDEHMKVIPLPAHTKRQHRGTHRGSKAFDSKRGVTPQTWRALRRRVPRDAGLFQPERPRDDPSAKGFDVRGLICYVQGFVFDRAGQSR